MEPTADFRHVETLRTSASPERVFALWSDPTTWATWDPPVERVVLDGPFRIGTQGTMVMVGGIEILAGLVVAIAPRFGSLLVAGWLGGIIVSLLLVGGYGDIALRDFGLLLSALTLFRLASAYSGRAPNVDHVR